MEALISYRVALNIGPSFDFGFDVVAITELCGTFRGKDKSVLEKDV